MTRLWYDKYIMYYYVYVFLYVQYLILILNKNVCYSNNVSYLLHLKYLLLTFCITFFGIFHIIIDAS